MNPSRSLMFFSLGFAVFLLSPAYLVASAPPEGLLRVGDLLDLFTPLVLVPLYALLLYQRDGAWPRWPKMLLFLLLCAAWVEGHSVHLAANALGHLLDAQPPSAAYRLDYFLDEHLSHVVWHAAIILLACLLLVRGKLEMEVSRLSCIVSAVPYGFSYFAITVEGQTSAMGIVAALALSGFIASKFRERRRDAYSVFFLIAHLLALILYLIWFLMNGGLPQFSEVGLLK